MKAPPPPKNQASGASETTCLFCTRISSTAGIAGELKQHRKEPNMAKRNTNPGIGESVDSGVMHTPQPTRSRTRTRGMSYGDINNIPLTVIPHARVRTYARTAHRVRRRHLPNGAQKHSAAISIPCAKRWKMPSMHSAIVNLKSRY